MRRLIKEVIMAVSTSSSESTFLGNGVINTFSINWILASASDVQVYYNGPSNATPVLLPTSSYNLTINPVLPNQIWGIGGSLVYPLSGSPIANGTSITVKRIVPFVQLISIENQGAFSPEVIEEMGDNLEFQIQQVSSRTTQFRGVWATNVLYNIGDIVQDGVNGANTNNYYICQIANTSSTWATDLANGDWALSVLATVPVGGNITLTGDVTGASSGGVLPSTISTNVVTNAKLAQAPALTMKGNDTGITANVSDLTVSQVQTLLGFTSFASVRSTFENLVGVYSSNTQASWTADQLLLQNASSVGYLLSPLSVTVNTATSGANGLDTGSLAASTWYYVFSIWNGTNQAVLMSLSSTSPTLPAGYTYFARISSIYLDSSKHIRGFSQEGRNIQHKVGSNLSGLPIVVSGSNGDPAIPTWASAVVNTSIPPTAATITVTLGGVLSGTVQAIAAPNSSYGAFNSTSNPPPLVIGTSSANAINVSGTFVCEQKTFFYYASNSSNTFLAVQGYEDNL